MKFIAKIENHVVTDCDISFTGNVKLIEDVKYTSTITAIGPNACTYGKLRSLDLTQTSIVTISEDAFLKCSLLSEIKLPQTLKTLESHCFAHTNIQTLELPSGIDTFTPSAVNQVLHIESITITGSQKYVSENGFLYNAEKTRLLFVPRSITSTDDIHLVNQIETIAAYSLTSTQFIKFKGWKNLQFIEENTFHAILNLRVVDLRETKICEIPYQAFRSVPVVHIYFPTSLETLKNHAFEYCRNLRLVALFKNVSVIQEKTFYNCTRLSKIFYFGSNDFSDINMFEEMTQKIKIYVTDDYKHNKFAQLPVDFDWYRKEPMTCIVKQKRFNSFNIATISLFLFS